MIRKLYLSFLLFTVFGTAVNAQKATVVEIEKLSPPEKLLKETAAKDLPDLYRSAFEKMSPLPDSLVFYQDHPFLTGFFNAYKDHRPVVLSPDMIWLLISQGFARHIDNNREALRRKLVNFEGRKVLTVMANDIKLGNANSNWEALFPQFNQQISLFTGKKFVKNLTADFSTTTPTTKIASEITLMEGMRSYFVYQVILISCGIPRVTIEGTVEDWEKVLQKIKFIKQYDLSWWTTELEPIVKEIIQAKKGKPNNEFWMNMIKVHTTKAYGTVNTIDGWITKLFPYNKKGLKTNFKPISDIGGLAPELVKVPFILEDKVTRKTYNMEFWAGFVGLRQNKNDFSLKPEIGWAISSSVEGGATMSKSDALSVYNITEIPNEVYAAKNLRVLELSFKNQIKIPDQLAEISILTLKLHGNITEEEEKRIFKLFPKTQIIINDKGPELKVVKGIR
ncbi:DUF4419 domain-containing protein [Pedobacter sp. HDW13]|uniref:DUF4419 domain-containing protein n=1 Tax=unclassified Pedobacter TaxID=2628915 RepID=UPI000F5B72DB|nr:MULTISPECIES: DUF4419 domain-containing protein [unclassified Pedobacter]QIL39462.1 DUF4419 domain-containing protein [Pedobacter sp. HDW13]RQO78652.1 hypothetical protein DBR40_06845 [Pedobacter sp. KBW01]